MKKTDVIVIGAGAAGLMTASSLVKAGKTVTILEARDRIGGRIYTGHNDLHFKNAELGAEFIHGDLPVTLELLKEAGISSMPIHFEMWRYKNGQFEVSETNVEGWDQLLEKLNQLQHDMPIHEFLQQYFPDEKYTAMRAQIEGFVNGYDTADVLDVSSFALRSEWSNEDDDVQYRIEGGYMALINYLAGICRSKGNEIVLNKVVKEINWEKSMVSVTAVDGTGYEAGKLVVALPLGVLQAADGEEGAISFRPSLETHERAIQDIGFGSVIKILLEFDEAFWEQNEVLKTSGADQEATRLFTGSEAIPTFWTQAPSDRPLLTGWLGGPAAGKKKDMPEEEMIQSALQSLSHIFNVALGTLQQRLQSWYVMNWPAEAYTRGSYAYDKVESADARKVLRRPLEETIFFAGEYLYDGSAMGTVEAALTSGRDAAERVLRYTH